MPRWQDRLEELLCDGEVVEQQVDIGTARVVVTSHRVLAFTLEMAGKNLRQVDRPNVIGLERPSLTENALERLKSFEPQGKAEPYADVYTIVGGFREAKTGNRGVQPATAAAREDALMAYLTAQPTMSLEWVARFYDEDQAVIRRYVTAVQERAAEQRANGGSA